MRGKYSRIVWSGALALLLAAMTGLAQAGPKPLPPNSHAFGKGYAELTAEWVEWILAIPAAVNPLFDDDGEFAAEGQSGKVWFLVGNAGGVTTRTVTVPTGTALFFPIVNYLWVNTPEFGDPAWSPEQEANARAIARGCGRYSPRPAPGNRWTAGPERPQPSSIRRSRRVYGAGRQFLGAAF